MVRSMTVSPDGACLALGGMQHSLYVVHVGSGRAAQLVGHAAPVAALAWSCDGRALVSAARSTLMVWDAAAAAATAEPPPLPKLLNQMPGS